MCRLIILISLSVSLLLSSCVKKADSYDIQNLNNNDIQILGHRGMGELYRQPGNTYEAIYPVIGIGAAGAEIDIQLTKDSVLVLYHNDDLNVRTTCEGQVYDYKYAEIGGCKYRGISYNIYVITVDNLFSRLENINDLYFSFDCKKSDNIEDTKSYYRTYARAIKKLCEEYKLTNNVYIEGQEEFLEIIKEQGLENKLFVTGYGDIKESVNVAKKLDAYGIGTGINTSKEDVEYAHENNLFVMMWGGKTKAENKELIRKFPDIIQTDKPIYLLKVFDRFNKDYKIP